MVLATLPEARPRAEEPASQGAACRLADTRQARRERPLEAGSQAGSGKPFYRPELDLLRLGAFFMVWLAHSLPGAKEAASLGIPAPLAPCIEAVKDAGNFGVCVFFFLSAYLITELLRRERAATGTIRLRAFYVRRILRIWPLYLGILGAYAVLGLRFHGFRIEPGRLLASVLLAGNWYIALHPTILTPMRALWSISVEEQFYLGWPVLVRWARPRVVVAACIALPGLSYATLVWLVHHTNPQQLHVTAWVNSFVQFQYFAIGALAALALGGRSVQVPTSLRCALLAGAAAAMLVAAGTCGVKRPTPFHTAVSLSCGYLLVGLGCALLFVAVLGLSPRLAPAWAVKLGQISFGLYVFHELGFFLTDALERLLLRYAGADRFATVTHQHWAIALATNKLCSLACTAALAFASYEWWEKPFLRLKRRFTLVPSRQA